MLRGWGAQRSGGSGIKRRWLPPELSPRPSVALLMDSVSHLAQGFTLKVLFQSCRHMVAYCLKVTAWLVWKDSTG